MAQPADVARIESERLGVCLAYILGPFAGEARTATAETNPNFHVIAKSLFYGPTGRGKGKVCPRDQLPDCSFVDALEESQKGSADTYLFIVLRQEKAKRQDTVLNVSETNPPLPFR